MYLPLSLSKHFPLNLSYKVLEQWCFNLALTHSHLVKLVLRQVAEFNSDQLMFFSSTGSLQCEKCWLKILKTENYKGSKKEFLYDKSEKPRTEFYELKSSLNFLPLNYFLSVHSSKLNNLVVMSVDADNSNQSECRKYRVRPSIAWNRTQFQVFRIVHKF